MSVDILERAGNVVEIDVSGKLEHTDYERFVPQIEADIKAHGKVRMIVVMRDFHGWSMGALWDDLKFDWNHYSDIEKLALVGESKWEKGMEVFCKPFTSAEIKYFNVADEAAARQWIEAD